MYLKVLLIRPNACIALFAALEHCIENFRAESIQIPKSLISFTDDKCSLLPTEYSYLVLGPRCITKHLAMLNLNNQSLDQAAKMFKSFCNISESLRSCIVRYIFKSSANI